MTLLRRCILGVALLGLVPGARPQGILSQILTNGPTAKRINIVFLSEGYLPSQTNQFASDVGRALAGMIRTPPFDAYSNYFNAFTIFVPSVEAGSDHPSTGVFKDTYFNSSYDSYGIARLITIPPNDRDGTYANGQGKVNLLLQNLMPEYDLSVLIVNDAQYGGSGGSPLIASVNASSAEIATHELGHTYSGLGDEYDAAYPGYPDTEEPNTTRQTNRTLIKWTTWILPSTPVPTPETPAYAALVGLFEGAHYHATAWYRPKLDCKMNHLGVPFCEICSEALVKSTYHLVHPIESNSPSTNAVINLIDPQTGTFAIERPRPATYDLSVQWFTNNIAVPGATNGQFTIAASALPSGTNLVKVEVSDPTTKVRNDPLQVLKDSRTWRVNVQLRPVLGALRAQDKIVLSWPASSSGFVLESKTGLDPGTPWSPTGLSPVLVGNRLTVTNLIGTGSEYYRLRQQ
ncbi:MAG TPA: M64 family metallopeptidase [Verrucomicrobiae bacterium]